MHFIKFRRRNAQFKFSHKNFSPVCIINSRQFLQCFKLVFYTVEPVKLILIQTWAFSSLQKKKVFTHAEKPSPHLISYNFNKKDLL